MADGSIGAPEAACEASFDLIGLFRDTECPNLEEMQACATARGGACLASEYLGAKHKHGWRCACGNEWDATPAAVLGGTWCPAQACVNERIREKKRARDAAAGCTIEALRQIAAQRGGECLSASYEGVSVRLRWRCALLHEWEATPGSIKAGTWCPRCSRMGGSAGERVCRAVLERMFGCSFPKRRPDWLGGDKGRPLELDGYAEQLKVAFEYHGNHHYLVTNRTNQKLLDEQKERDTRKARLCWEAGVSLIVVHEFRDRLKLAGQIDQIEAAVLFAGLRVPRGWKRPASLPEAADSLALVLGQDVVDRLNQIAAEKGGRLLSGQMARAHDLLLWECAKGHRWETRASSVLRLGQWCRFCSKETIAQKNRERIAAAGNTIEGMRRRAAERGGLCLSAEYVDSQTKLTWKCAEGHEWEARPNTIQHGSWCPECARKTRVETRKARYPARPKPPRPRRGDATRGSIADMQKLAAKRGGDCLSVVYENNHTKLEWRCASGHRWLAVPMSIRVGRWCPWCSGRKNDGIEMLRRLAAERGGKCLSDTYGGAKVPVDWECAQGHRWSVLYSSVKTGTWCPTCALETHSQRCIERLTAQGHTIERLKGFALARGGECLSDTYQGMAKHYDWRCSDGHEWSAVANSIQQGSWCPTCANIHRWDGRRKNPAVSA